MKSKKFRTQFEARVVGKSFSGVKSRTDPQYLNDCSIEGIVRRYGVIPSPTVKPIGRDVSEYQDFGACMEKAREGCEMFAALPSTIRDRFGNDPRAFFDWIHDENNTAEAVKLGLMVEVKEEKTEKDYLAEIAEKVTPAGASS